MSSSAAVSSRGNSWSFADRVCDMGRSDANISCVHSLIDFWSRASRRNTLLSNLLYVRALHIAHSLGPITEDQTIIYKRTTTSQQTVSLFTISSSQSIGIPVSGAFGRTSSHLPKNTKSA